MDTGTATRTKPERLVKARRMSHGTLMCADRRKTRRFYEEFLGLETVIHSKNSMMVGLSTDFHVVCVSVRPEKLANMHVFHHWGIDVDTRAEVDAAFQRANELKDTYGIKKIMKPVEQHRVYSFYLQDLDNNWWEIQHTERHHDEYFARGDQFDLPADDSQSKPSE
jgi:catechol 2,3-dioxygenase-like lactoylglutathione lyase family enzyme